MQKKTKKKLQVLLLVAFAILYGAQMLRWSLEVAMDTRDARDAARSKAIAEAEKLDFLGRSSKPQKPAKVVRTPLVTDTLSDVIRESQLEELMPVQAAELLMQHMALETSPMHGMKVQSEFATVAELLQLDEIYTLEDKLANQIGTCGPHWGVVCSCFAYELLHEKATNPSLPQHAVIFTQRLAVEKNPHTFAALTRMIGVCTQNGPSTVSKPAIQTIRQRLLSELNGEQNAFETIAESSRFFAKQIDPIDSEAIVQQNIVQQANSSAVMSPLRMAETVASFSPKLSQPTIEKALMLLLKRWKMAYADYADVKVSQEELIALASICGSTKFTQVDEICTALVGRVLTQTSNSGLQPLIEAIILITSQASDACILQLAQRLADVAFIEDSMSANLSIAVSLMR